MNMKMENINNSQHELAERLVALYLDERSSQKRVMANKLTELLNESALISNS